MSTFDYRDLTKPRGGQNLKKKFGSHPTIWQINDMEAVQVVLYVKEIFNGICAYPPSSSDPRWI